MVSKGSKAFYVFAAAQIAGALLSLLGNLLPKQDSSYMILAVLLLVVGILSIVSYFMYIGYLSKSKTMLAK